MLVYQRVMWVKQCHKPPIWEWSVYTTYKFMVIFLGDGKHGIVLPTLLLRNGLFVDDL